MAYHSTSGTATNTADLLTKLKDFLVTTCGWTLHDDGSATAEPYYVLKSVGESGNEDIYIQFINDTASTMRMTRSPFLTASIPKMFEVLTRRSESLYVSPFLCLIE